MNDSERDSVDPLQVLLKTVASQAETIRLQAETIFQLMGSGVEEEGPATPTTFLDGSPL